MKRCKDMLVREGQVDGAGPMGAYKGATGVNAVGVKETEV